MRKRRAVRKVRFQVEINEIAWASNSLLFMSQSIRQTGVEEGLVQVMKCDSKLNLTPVLKVNQCHPLCAAKGSKLLRTPVPPDSCTHGLHLLPQL